MKLVIERMGGFDIIDSADVERIEVESKGVQVCMTDGTDVFADRESHAESVATATAIAAKCGALVEPLAAGPKTVQASEWVEGEPPRDGRFWVTAVAAGVAPGLSRWDGKRWHDGDGATYECALLAHLPTPIPPFAGAGAEGGK